MFQDLGSSPASMEAGKACDAFGSMPGYDVEQADAEQAYVQAPMKSNAVTWVQLPRDQWPQEWERMTRPIVVLQKALYGHPDSGTYWEQHCNAHCESVGFVPIPDWPSCYHMKWLDLFPTIYVYDAKMAGPKENLTEGWKLLRGHASNEGGKG